MKSKRMVSVWLVTATILASVSVFGGAQSASTLADQFKNPPDSAKPRAWWHWMSGNRHRAWDHGGS
jgi:hypothetical protein